MAKVRITQVISTNGATKKQIANLRTLGIHRMNHSVEVELTPVTEGQLSRVRHLVQVEEI